MSGRFIAVRDRRLSLWQSAVREATGRSRVVDPATKSTMCRAADLHAQAAANGLPIARPARTPGAPLTLEDHVLMSRAYLDLAEARREGNQPRAQAAISLIRDYSEFDPGWAECVALYNLYYVAGGNQAYYNDWTVEGGNDLNYSVIQWQLPNDAKVLLLGDWGTGMTDAVAMLQQAIATLQPDAIIHLGDVYYSGTSTECTNNVVRVLNAVFQGLQIGPIPFFTIPGNHEYYSGGAGFYGMLGALNQGLPECVQPASYFCLRTQDNLWQFLGMDTGVNDHNANMDAIGTIGMNPLNTGPGLNPTEVAWQIDKFLGFSGNTILLSHHQLFTANAEINGSLSPYAAFINDSLFDIFMPYFDRISAWFWGHEHNLAAYQNGLFGLNMGRLVGCSAYEELESQDPYAVNNPQVPYSQGQVGLGQSPYTTAKVTFFNHGLALIDMARADPSDPINVTYYQFPSWDQSQQVPSPLPPLAELFSETIGDPDAEPTYVWTGNKTISTASSGSPESNAGPALAYFNDLLYMAYKGATLSTLYLAWYDGTQWYGNTAISDMPGGISPQTNATPALATFNGKLYMAYQGEYTTTLYLAWYDGTQWYGNTAISDMPGGISPDSSASPALAAFDGKLYMAYIGAYTTTLYLAWYDGTQWYGNTAISDMPGGISPLSGNAPSLAVYAPVADAPQLYMTYTGAYTSTMYWASFDGTQWQGNEPISTSNGDPESSSTPWMAPIGDGLFMLYMGQLYSTIYQSSLDMGDWWGNQSLGSFSPISPETNFPGSVVPYGAGLYMVYKAAHSNSLYYAQYSQTGGSLNSAPPRRAGGRKAATTPLAGPGPIVP